MKMDDFKKNFLNKQEDRKSSNDIFKFLVGIYLLYLTYQLVFKSSGSILYPIAGIIFFLFGINFIYISGKTMLEDSRKKAEAKAEEEKIAAQAAKSAEESAAAPEDPGAFYGQIIIPAADPDREEAILNDTEQELISIKDALLAQTEKKTDL